MDAKGIASELGRSARNPLAPGRGRHTVAMLQECYLGTMVIGNTMGSKDLPLPWATEDISILLVMDTTIKWVIAALDRFGGRDGDIEKSKEIFQGHFLPEYIF